MRIQREIELKQYAEKEEQIRIREVERYEQMWIQRQIDLKLEAERREQRRI